MSEQDAQRPLTMRELQLVYLSKLEEQLFLAAEEMRRAESDPRYAVAAGRRLWHVIWPLSPPDIQKELKDKEDLLEQVRSYISAGRGVDFYTTFRAQMRHTRELLPQIRLILRAVQGLVIERYLYKGYTGIDLNVKPQGQDYEADKEE